MIEVNYKNNKELFFSIKGHANYSENNDLVCAGVSSIVFGILNSLKSHNFKGEIKVEENKILIKDETIENNNIKIVFETLIIQLKTVEDKYPSNIKINKIDN